VIHLGQAQISDCWFVGHCWWCCIAGV